MKVAFAHYQFATIHPFMAGNGLIGQILPYMMLVDKKILTRPFICLSHNLNANKVEYTDRMKALQRKCDYEQWVKFYVRAVLFAAENSLENIRKRREVRKKSLAMIEKCGKSIKEIRSFYDSIERYRCYACTSFLDCFANKEILL